jgi:hypothetical protein
MRKIFATRALLGLLLNIVFSQTQSDTIVNYRTLTPITIDGLATEECWTNAEWHAIDQVWMPYGATMTSGDFEGRLKVAWDANYLYVLVEVVDDLLSDDHAIALSNWWEDDCLEIFIDEDRSKGIHTTTCNAFAYHVSLTYDAIDLNSAGNGVNYKNNLQVVRTTIGTNTYLWEFAIKIYNSSFILANPEASRVNLVTDKKMGFAIAYCDNDETTGRENFIGSMYLTSTNNNAMYQNADYFGPMVLSEPESSTNVAEVSSQMKIKVYPVPAQDYLTIETSLSSYEKVNVSIVAFTGQVLKREAFFGSSHRLDMTNLDSGIYILSIISGERKYSQIIEKK